MLAISIIFSLIVRTIFLILVCVDRILEIITKSIEEDTILYSAWILMVYTFIIMLPQGIMLTSLNHGISQKQEILETQAQKHPISHNSNQEED